jgi:hypothetical protein
MIGPEVVGKRTGETGRDMSGAKSYVKDQLLGWMDVDQAASQQWFENLKNEAFQNALLETYTEEINRAKQKP